MEVFTSTETIVSNITNNTIFWMKVQHLLTHNKYFHSKGLTQIDCKGKMKGGIGWSLRTSGVDRDI